jgi:hypothetical protein
MFEISSGKSFLANANLILNYCYYSMSIYIFERKFNKNKILVKSFLHVINL